jgi:DNA (cytosine-5)-methyltransferase 1
VKAAPVTADLLAGGGGSSCGAEQAGARVVLAVNHNDRAIAIHRRNHPFALHVCQDVQLVDYTPWRRRLDLLLASPACQGHSKASSRGGTGRRGSAPKHDADRATALAVISALEQSRPPVAVVENVVEFRTWELFPWWCEGVRTLGYAIAEHVIDAADHGCPADRPRLFLTLTRSRTPFRLQLQPEARVGVGSVFDPSATRWGLVSRMPAPAQARIARARQRGHRGMMVVRYTTDDVGRRLDQTIGCITTAHQVAWVRPGPRGDERRMFTSREYLRCLGFPEAYHLTGLVSHDVELLGNAVSPRVMRAIVADLVARA